MANLSVTSRIAGFRTSFGSTYQILGNTTQRYKTPHADHGVEDIGLKRPSERTLYLEDRDAQSLGMHGQLQGLFTCLSVRDNRLLPLFWDSPKGKWNIYATQREGVCFTETPAIGLAPVELWGQGIVKGFGKADLTGWKVWHAGNAIIEVWSN